MNGRNSSSKGSSAEEEIQKTSSKDSVREDQTPESPREESNDKSDTFGRRASVKQDSVKEERGTKTKPDNGMRNSERWRNMIERIEEEKISIAAFLEEATPILRNQDLYLEFEREYSFHKESLEDNKNFSYLKKVVNDCFDGVDELRITYSDRESEAADEMNLLEEKTELVKDKFGGNVVEKGRS